MSSEESGVREPVALMKKTLYVDMDNVLVDFSSGIARLHSDIASRYRDRLDEVPGIFALMDPMPHAIESFSELATLYDAYILSTARWRNSFPGRAGSTPGAG
jgi:5'(3')-deoxyribonucleotidase